MPATQEQLKLAAATLEKLLLLLGMTALVKPVAAGDAIELQVETAEAARMIGRKGQSAELLELVIERVARKDEPQFPRVRLCVDGYEPRVREERRGGGQGRGRGGDNFSGVDSERLERQAMDAAKEVKRWGDPKTIGPLPAPARRFVHMLFRDDKELESVSGADDGRGQKKVTIQLRQPR